MANYEQLMNLEKKQKKQPLPSSVQPVPSSHSSSQPIDQSARRLTSPSTNQSTKQLSANSDERTVGRPKSFYVTVRLDKRLDEAVRYFQEVHGIRKVDRSIIVNAMLDTDAQWTEEALDRLVERVMRLLTKKLMR
jgi:hypothetical protein